MAPYLRVQNLTKRYRGYTVLDVERLEISRGEVLALIGPNGSGKSTFLRLIAHLEKPDTGSIGFAGDRSAESDFSIRRRLAMVFQESLLFTGTVFDNIAYGLKVRRVAHTEIVRRTRAVADMFGIAHLLDRPSGSLSGGEAQRTSLARAFVLNPELLLLDEPMASLDPPTRESLLIDLYGALDTTNTTVIYVTHELREAMILADRCAFMDEGRIIQISEPREVMSQPINQKVADFVGVENIFKGRVIEDDGGLARIKVNGSEIEAVSHGGLAGNVWVFIRPENVTITLEESDKITSARNRFAGTVEKVLDLGVMYRVTVDCGFPLVVFITRRSTEEMNLKPGQQVWASFKATGIHVAHREG